MTRLEAINRAQRIWPEKRVSVQYAIGSSHEPGQCEWWVDIGNASHQLDCNGHTICHADCKIREGTLS